MVAAEVEGPIETATNLLAPKVTEYQLTAEGIVLAVHVIPSGDVAADAAPYAVVKKLLFP